MFELPDSWTWDFWVADTGDEYHLFFLFASRALGDPERRHRRASIGHAVSTDLRSWTRLPDALVRGDAGDVDDLATWTGSVVRGDDDLWRIFYTAVTDDPASQTQRVAVATSTDLFTWTKGGVVASATPDHYATADAAGAEPFRDPWVWRDDEGVWRMLVTASAPGVPFVEEGVLATASSPDLVHWVVGAPATGAGAGFSQLEVPSLVDLGDETILLFNCLAPEMSERRRLQSPTGGVWFAPVSGVDGAIDLDRSLPLTDESLYAGRAVRDRTGHWMLLAFENVVDGSFVGRLADPRPLDDLVKRARLSV